MKRTNLQILEEVRQTGIISERDVLLLKNRANKGDRDALERAQEVAENEPNVTPEQAEKGFLWLWGQYKTGCGALHKNNPFGMREIEVLETAKCLGSKFTFDGFYDAGRYGYQAYVPLYSLYNEAGSFQYYVWGGEVVIVG